MFEIKSKHTFNPSDVRTLNARAQLFPQSHSFVVYGGPQQGPFGDIILLSLDTLEAALK